MSEIVPANFDAQLPEFHSYYFDAGLNKLWKYQPVPNISVIHQTFASRLGKMDFQRRRVV